MPKAKSLVKLEDRSGIIYERIHGLEMYVVMSRQGEDIKKWGQVFAEIHRDVHNHALPSLPSAREELYHLIANCASLSLALRSKVLAVFDTLADDTVLCHGDFHPKNIIMTEEGPVIIDWMNGRSFHPLADVALSSVILQVAPGLPTWVNDFHDSYVKTYLELSGFDEASLARWQIPMAAARLCENHPDEGARILNLIEEAARCF